MKLDIKAFALTAAVVLGVGMFLLTWWMILFGGPVTQSTVLARMFPGYSITALGSVIALVWGLVDGAIGGGLFAWVYNHACGHLTFKHTHAHA